MPLQLPNFPMLTREQVSPVPSIQSGMMFPQQLRQAILENEFAKVKAQYAPVTIPAEAASKLAYANLMGPQFLAKLMGNPEWLASTPDPQKRAILDMINRVGTSQGLNNPYIAQALSQQGNNQFSNNVPVMRQQAVLSAPENEGRQIIGRTPEENQQLSQMQPGESYTAPEIPPTNKQAKTWAETTGEFKGVEQEGKQAGVQRAKAVAELGDQYEAGLNLKYAYDELTNTVSNPAWQQMRSQVPFFQDKQLKFLSKVGTPEQQVMIGDFLRSSKTAVADAFNSFRGQKMKGELTLSTGAEISDNDTIWSAMGKLQAGKLYNDMALKRTELASNLMRAPYHYDKQKALQIADKQVNGDLIRKQIYNELHPQPTEADIDYMANQYKISKSEVRKRLEKKGYKLEIQLQGEK